MNNNALRHAAFRHPQAIMQPFDVIMDDFGFDAVCSIVDYLGGMTVYIPSKRHIFMGCLQKEIANEHQNGTPPRDLIRKYGITDRTLRKILSAR
ncbi:MAG: hypothetical protein FWC71_11360 [Defluviitaleaceae bacterium]|nr:hypothetical protein [Defluviitaleaceae bacterium]